MSQVATLSIIEKKNLSNLESLAATAPVIKKNWLGQVKQIIDPFNDEFRSFVLENIQFNSSGYSFAVLVAYSGEKISFNWDMLHYERIANSLSTKRKSAFFIFSREDKTSVFSKLDPVNFSVDELAAYTSEFSEEPDDGTGLLEAIKALHSGLDKINYNTLLIVEVG